MSGRGNDRGRSRERGGSRDNRRKKDDKDRDFELEREYAPPARGLYDLPLLVPPSSTPASGSSGPADSAAADRRSPSPTRGASDPAESTAAGRRSASPTSGASDPPSASPAREASDAVESTAAGPSPTPHTEASNPLPSTAACRRRSASPSFDHFPTLLSTLGRRSPSPHAEASNPLPSTAAGTSASPNTESSSTPLVVNLGGDCGVRGSRPLRIGGLILVTSPTPQSDGAQTPSPQSEESNPPDSTSGGNTAARGSQPVPVAGLSVPVPSPTTSSQPADPDTPFRRTFMRLLQTYGKKGQGRSYYMAMAEFYAECDRFILDVDADHLLQDKEHMNLLIEVTRRANNDPEHSWLQCIAQEFWVQCGFKKDKKMLGFRFIHEPKLVRPLSSYSTEELVKRQDIYGDKYQMLRTRETGRLVYLSVLNHAVARHRSGRSYCGDFSEEDIYIIEYQGKGRLRCVILAATRAIYESDFAEKILDLKMIDTILTPKYKLDDEFPPFFPNLHEDLQGLTPNTLKDTGTLDVLIFHYSLMPLEAWGFLIWKLHLLIQQLRENGIEFKSVFGESVGQ